MVDIDPALLAAGDHHGATCYQHLGFRCAILDGAAVDLPASGLT
jgi:hypothetical protein